MHEMSSETIIVLWDEGGPFGKYELEKAHLHLDPAPFCMLCQALLFPIYLEVWGIRLLVEMSLKMLTHPVKGAAMECYPAVTVCYVAICLGSDPARKNYS